MDDGPKTAQSEIELLEQLDQRVTDLLAHVRKHMAQHVAAERATPTQQFVSSLRLISQEFLGEFDAHAAKDAIARTRLTNTEIEEE